MTRTFHLGDILSVTTSRLLSPRQIEGLFDILGYMTGETLLAHQLPRANQECEAPLLAQHPDLAGINPPDFDGEAEVWTWLAAMVDRYGETREVAPIGADQHTRIDPITEIRKMAPHAKIITVVVPEKP